MTEYFDIKCDDDLDPFARDVGPLEALGQDIYHWLITNTNSLLLDPGWGFGLEQYLGKPLPSSFASDIEIGVRDTFHDRVSDARCVVTPVAGELDSYRLDLTVEVDGEFLELALSMTPSGVRRL